MIVVHKLHNIPTVDNWLALDAAKSETMLEKGSIVFSHDTEINGYLYVKVFENEENAGPFIWLPVNLLKPFVDK